MVDLNAGDAPIGAALKRLARIDLNEIRPVDPQEQADALCAAVLHERGHVESVADDKPVRPDFDVLPVAKIPSGVDERVIPLHVRREVDKFPNRAG